MKLNDYEPTAAVIDDTPRPNASQQVARAKRLRQDDDRTEDAPLPARKTQSNAFPIGVGAVLLVAMVVAISYQFSTTPALRTGVPTEAPAHTFVAPPTSPPSPTSAPQPTSAPVFTPVPTAPPVEALQEAPAQTGRGLTISSVDEAVPTPAPQPSYIENVGAQAEHSPRGGLCGPTGGDCAPGVPFGVDGSEYIANVGAQVPHKVR